MKKNCNQLVLEQEHEGNEAGGGKKIKGASGGGLRRANLNQGLGSFHSLHTLGKKIERKNLWIRRRTGR